MKIYKLNKSVLSFKNDAQKFLNGLTSNQMSEPRNAFLNINGRVIATFDQVKINDEEYWIVLEKAYQAAVLEHVDRYARLSGVKIEERPENVYFNLQGDYPLASGDHDIPQKKGKLIVTSSSPVSSVTDDEFTLFRLRHQIPLHGVDFKDDMVLNISESEFVSFTKGCFLGQEPVAKVHNRSKPSWKLVVKSEDACSEEEKNKMTSRTFDPVLKETIGFVFVSNRD